VTIKTKAIARRVAKLQQVEEKTKKALDFSFLVDIIVNIKRKQARP
jgi:hypothetical protein